MKCPMCGNAELEVVEAAATRPVLVGIEGVTVSGVEVTRCHACGEEFEEFPPLEAIHSAIARHICQRGELTGAEIRFLRKRLGWSSADFASAFRTRRETVSRWEHDKSKMGEFEQHMLKMFAARGPLLDDYLHDLTGCEPANEVIVVNFNPPPPAGGAAAHGGRRRAHG